MQKFPKKYITKDIKNLSKQYKEKHSTPSKIVASFLPAAQTLHVGHFYSLYLKDLFYRFSELQGADWVEFLFFFQQNGIQTTKQVYDFFAKKGQIPKQVGFHKLHTYANALAQKISKVNTKNIDANFSSSHKFFDQEGDFLRFIHTTFKTLWKKGYVQQIDHVAYWSLELQTSIPLSQITFKKELRKNYTIKYFVEMKNDVLPVCAFTLDHIFGDVALLVHPQDKRYKKLIGKRALIPIVNRPIPIIGDESVNISLDNGIKRVCPAHDQESLLLAKKHQLPTNHYVFDKDGFYTEYLGEYAGKSRKDFSPNILQFLKDISNLGAIYEEEVDLPYHTETNLLLHPLLLSELIINVESHKEILQQFFEDHPQFAKFSLGREEKPLSITLNRQLPWGYSIPLWRREETGELTMYTPADIAQRRKDPQQICFDYILFRLAEEGYPAKGDPERIFSLCSRSFSVLENAITDLIQENLVSQQEGEAFRQCFIINQESEEHAIDSLIERSLFLQEEEGEYHFTLTKFLWGKEQHAYGEVFDSDVVNLLFLLYLQEYNYPHTEKMYIESAKKDWFLPLFFLQLCLWRKNTLQNLEIFPSLPDKNKERFSYYSLQTTQLKNSLQDYGENAVRLSLLIQQNIEESIIKMYDNLLRQIWNGVRYISANAIPSEKTEVLLSTIEEKADAFDFWILGEFSALYQEYLGLTPTKDLIEFFPKRQQFIQQKFLNRYLEVQKYQESAAKNEVLSLISQLMIQILVPYVPSYAEALAELTKVNLSESFLGLRNFPVSFQEKQLYTLYERIYIAKRRTSIKKHEPIHLFLKTDPNFLEFFAEHEGIFKKILHIIEIKYIRLHEQEPLGYEQEADGGITIGIKAAIQSPGIKKESLEDIEEEYRDQCEHLEYLRMQIRNLTTYGANDQLHARMQEMEEVKEKIQRLEIQIQKKKLK